MTFDLSKDIRPVTEFRNKSSAFLKDLEEGHAIVLTQHGKPAAVIESVASFQRREEELRYLRGIVAGMRDMEAGRVEAGETAFRKVRNSLKKRVRP